MNCRWIAAALVALLLAPGAVAAEPAYAWFPLDEGRQIDLDLERERRVETVGGTSRSHFRGSAQLRVAARHGGVVSVTRVESQTQAGLGPPGQPEVSQLLEVYSSTADEVLFHAQKRVGGTDEREVYDPPRHFLKGPLEKGRRWSVGELRRQDLRMDLEAEVAGIGPLTVGGQEHAKVLEVRFTGSVSGRVDGQSLQGGQYERTVWLAKGKGLIQEVVQAEFRLTNADGTPITLVDTATFRLAAPRASDAPGSPLLR
ncbi:MAG: hypothetical protein QNK05_00605 [Myxococcota bacterium]|nr:hypothetical protein [Myxococcota bacterium]